MTEPPQRPNPKDLVALLQHDWKVALSYWTGIVVLGGTLIICWFDDDVGPGHPVFATLLAGWTLMLGSGLVAPAIRFLSPRWWRVPEGERALHAILGVSVFGWLLDRSGWNRHQAAPMRGFDGTRAGLASLEQSVRGAASAHGASFAVHMGLAAVAFFTGHPWGALWILLPGVVVHLYPVLLQRSLMLRLQPLLASPGGRRVVPGAC